MINIIDEQIVGKETVAKLDIIFCRGLTTQYADTNKRYFIEVFVVYKAHLITCEPKEITSMEGDIHLGLSVTFCLAGLASGDETNDDVVIYLCRTSSSSDYSGTPSVPVGFSHCRSLIARASFDVRLCFVHTGDFMSIELFSCLDTNSISDLASSGALFVRMGLIVGTEQPRRKPAEIMDWIRSSQENVQRSIHAALNETRQFWSNLRLKHFRNLDMRSIKLFSSDECGQSRLVSSFISPIKPPRSGPLSESPSQSARFVSLLPFKKGGVSDEGGVLGMRGESSWHPAQAMFVRLCGNVEDHATLLCSLLLGWGLDAYVAYGLISTTFTHSGFNEQNKRACAQGVAHYWVVTLDSADDGKVVFWEPLTGQSYFVQLDSSLQIVLGRQDYHSEHPFRYLFMMFRHDRVLVNLEDSPIVSRCSSDEDTCFSRWFPSSVATGRPAESVGISFDLTNQEKWGLLLCSKRCSQQRHPAALVCSDELSLPFHIAQSTMSLDLVVERKVKETIAQCRREVGLGTFFDDDMATILQASKTDILYFPVQQNLY